MPVVSFAPAFMATGLVVPVGKQKIEYSVSDKPGLFVECRGSAKPIPTWYLRLKNAKGNNTYRRLRTIKPISLPPAKKLVCELFFDRMETCGFISTVVTALSGGIHQPSVLAGC